ncbi:hypothetical protein [Roseomonas sp. USHLN139]|uniref:hypothetical protein n=1 Tax=Roseomonas sp. USHLN139 TaxID=3081298 RepID=UPI003B01D1EB
MSGAGAAQMSGGSEPFRWQRALRQDLLPETSLRLRQLRLAPQTAAEMLQQQHPQARRIDTTVRAYAEAMREGRWVANGMPLIMSQQGVLLDGVQRLAACIEAETAFDTLVVEGVEDAAFHTIDQHRPRSLSGILRPRGVVNHHLLANLLMRLVRYDEGNMTKPLAPRASWTQLEQLLAHTDAHRKALAQSLAMPGSPLPEPVRTMILFMGHQVNPGLTDRLLHAVQYPGQWPPHEPGVMLRHEIERGGLSNSHLIALSIKALNALLRNEQLRRLTWVERAGALGPAEPFPELEGYRGLAALTGARPEAGEPGAEEEPPQAEARVEAIDASLAMRYLRMNVAGRRPVKSHVDALARDIRRGRWMTNGQPICFSRSGLLINGQHRLLAVIAAQGQIIAPVVRGLPEEAYATYDAQPRRLVRSQVAEGNFGDQALAVAMANLLWRLERKTPAIRSKRAAATEIHEILTQNPRLLELRGFARKMVEYGRSSVMGYGAYVIERDDPRLAPAFLNALATGADLPAGHPILALRRGLQKLRRDNASQADQLSALLAGWRQYKAHQASEKARSPR